MVAYKNIFYEFHWWGMVMKNPWVGKKIWNKVYKGEILIDQEQSHEIRENKKSKQTDSEKKRKQYK